MYSDKSNRTFNGVLHQSRPYQLHCDKKIYVIHMSTAIRTLTFDIHQLRFTPRITLNETDRPTSTYDLYYHVEIAHWDQYEFFRTWQNSEEFFSAIALEFNNISALGGWYQKETYPQLELQNIEWNNMHAPLWSSDTYEKVVRSELGTFCNCIVQNTHKIHWKRIVHCNMSLVW